MKLKEPNALNFFNLRKLKVPAAHFEFIVIPMTYNIEDALSRWIVEHLKGRYYVGKALSIKNQNTGNQITTCIKVGFEDPKELSYFTLACPHLKY